MFADQLPDETLLTIFSHVPVTTLKRSLRRCCRRFHRLCDDESLWRDICFKNGRAKLPSQSWREAFANKLADNIRFSYPHRDPKPQLLSRRPNIKCIQFTDALCGEIELVQQALEDKVTTTSLQNFTDERAPDWNQSHIILMKGVPCKVNQVYYSKPGYHGMWKAHLQGKNLFTQQPVDSLLRVSNHIVIRIHVTVEVVELVELDGDEVYAIYCSGPIVGAAETFPLPKHDVRNEIIHYFSNPRNSPAYGRLLSCYWNENPTTLIMRDITHCFQVSPQQILNVTHKQSL